MVQGAGIREGQCYYGFQSRAALRYADAALLPEPQRAHDWLRKPNAAPFLGGCSALDRMLGVGRG